VFPTLGETHLEMPLFGFYQPRHFSWFTGFGLAMAASYTHLNKSQLTGQL